ncbi:hypothetical protein ACN20G_08860 [Streptomyces sp. BI20]|uniref:hypothetical protein n=1 Tax=Streptomyces sp. BI20 TaxID=3403460 RepID=UPI003C720246
MSYGDPNNPYGQQPPQNPPGYGYPHGAAPAYGAPAYGATPYGGSPQAPMQMPGGVRLARVCLWITVAFQIIGLLIGAIALLVAGSLLSDLGDLDSSSGHGYGSASGDEFAAVAIGFAVVIGVLVLGFMLWTILTAAKIGKGGGGVRVSGIILGSLMSAGGAFSVLSSLTLFGADSGGLTPIAVVSLLMNLFSLALGLGVLIGLAGSPAGHWFRRPRPGVHY